MSSLPRFEQLAPRLLTTDKNVRKDLNLTKEFLASVKLKGVLNPIVAYPDPINDGAYRIYIGHRRAAAAIEGNVGTIPVYIISERDAADRVAEQLAENIHRADLTPAEVAGGYAELALFGQSAMAIARQTSTKLAVVGDAIKVAKAPAATKALEQYQLSIDSALVFAEFADDPAALASLGEQAERDPDRLTHRAQVLRNEHTETLARQAVVEQIREAGIVLLTEVPQHDNANVRRAEEIFTGEKMSTVVPLARILAEAGTDLRAYAKRTFGSYGHPSTYAIGYAVTNWADHGWFAQLTTATTRALSPAEKEQRRLSRENSKLWHAATQVRLAWVTDLLARKALPGDAVALAAGYFATMPNDYGNKIINLAHRLIGVARLTTLHVPGDPGYGQITSNELPGLVAQTPAQAPHVLFAIAAAGIESGIDEKKGWATTGVQFPRYLSALAGWGYTLSELEATLAATTAAA